MLLASNSKKSISLILATVCWGLAIPLSKMALSELTPRWLIFLQIAASVAALWLAAIVSGVRFAGISRRNLALTAAIGILEPFGAYYLGFIGVQHTSSLHASVIFATEPLGIVALNILLFRARIDLRLLLAGVVALSGVLLIATQDLHTGDHTSLHGDVLIFIGTMIAALYVSLSTQYVTIPSVLSMLIIQQTASLLLAGIFLAVGIGLNPGMERLPSGHAALAAMGIGILAFSLAFLFYFWGSKTTATLLVDTTPLMAETTEEKHTSTSYWSVIVLNFTPIVGIVASCVLLGESVTTIYVAGGTLTIAAAVYTHLREKQLA